MRAALHAHILVWFRPRRLPDGYKGVPPIQRTAPGSDLRQRPRDVRVSPLKEEEKVHDHVYHCAHVMQGFEINLTAPLCVPVHYSERTALKVGAVTAEMVRPDVSGPEWGGYALDQLRIAGRAGER